VRLAAVWPTSRLRMRCLTCELPSYEVAVLVNPPSARRAAPRADEGTAVQPWAAVQSNPQTKQPQCTPKT